LKQIFYNKRVVAALVLPSLFAMIFAMVVPICFSLFYSFTDWTGVGKIDFVGFRNFREILVSDTTFRRSLANVLILLAVMVVVENPLAFALAAVLTGLREKESRFFRTIYFIPVVLSMVVITALWRNVLNPTYGIFNKLLSMLLGVPIANAWLANPSTALGSVIWIIVWQNFGWNLLILFSGLIAVPKELIEAARVDGAGRWTTYTKVIIPSMYSVISMSIVSQVIWGMKQMEIPFLATNGGPGDLTQFAAVYLYQKAFVSGEYGYGNALSTLFVVFAMGLTIAVQRAFGRFERAN
jgi:raffinose/stachyose/melibiose transport system permease protein